MSHHPAFTSPLPVLRPQPARPSLSSTRPRRLSLRPTMQSSNLPNFDEIAEQLSKELQARRSAQADAGAPMPPTDAPPSEQPFEVTVGPNDMPKLIMRHPPSAQEVEVFTYGAAVTSWTTRDENHFWLSDTNKWEPGGKAIRGGIPICFPQFGPYGDLVQHGFARVSDWEIKETMVNEDGSVSSVFGLDSEMDQDGLKAWPHKFDAEYTVTLSYVGLETKLSVTNKDSEPFEFTAAFHNYFKVTKVDNARVFGYEGCKFLNRLEADKEMPAEEDTGAGFLISQETDRIYLNVPEELAMFDFASLKVLKIKKTPTLGDTTLWNPYGSEGADPGWGNFVCIEPACITKPAKLQPGETWVGAQLLGVE